MGEKISILKALEKVVESIKAWTNNNFIKTINGIEPDEYGNITVNGDYLPISGGELTGDLKVGSSSIGANGYVVGTWLQSTADNTMNSAPPKICVQDDGGWIYSRTPKQILGDIGAQPAGNYALKNEIPTVILPTVSAADNGKVLMVVDGTWKAVNITMSIDSNGVVSI